MSVRLFFFFDREKKGIAIHKRVKRIRLLNDTARMHFVWVWVWVCAYGKVFLSGWTSERVSLLTIQFGKLKSTYLGVDEWNYIAMQYTFHVFHLCVFVYCTCAKLNLSLPPKNVETWLHCCFIRMCVPEGSNLPCQCQYQLQSKGTHTCTHTLLLECVDNVAEDNKYYISFQLVHDSIDNNTYVGWRLCVHKDVVCIVLQLVLSSVNTLIY